jgi:hypothetical protein
MGCLAKASAGKAMTGVRVDATATEMLPTSSRAAQILPARGTPLPNEVAPGHYSTCASTLLGDKTTVNDQLCPCHKGGLVRGEIQGTVGDVLRGAESPQGNRAQTPLHGRLRVFVAALQHGGIDGTGVDGITPDLIFGVLDGGDFGKDAHGTFRGVVGLYCWGFS